MAEIAHDAAGMTAGLIFDIQIGNDIFKGRGIAGMADTAYTVCGVALDVPVKNQIFHGLAVAIEQAYSISERITVIIIVDGVEGDFMVLTVKDIANFDGVPVYPRIFRRANLNVCYQNGILAVVIGAVPQQLTCVADLIYTVHEVGGLIDTTAVRAEAVFIELYGSIVIGTVCFAILGAAEVTDITALTSNNIEFLKLQ